MSDSPDNTAGASPYGPAEGSPEAAAATPPSLGYSDPAANDSAAVTKARATIGRLAVVLPIVGVGLIIAATLAWVVFDSTTFDPGGLVSLALGVLSFLGPVLLVLGLHMVVWRALVRPLAGMQSGARTGTIIGVGAVLSFVSVPIVAILVFIGFSVISAMLDAISGFS